MINFKDRVWPSDYKNHGLLISTARLVYEVYDYGYARRFLSACVIFLDNRVRLPKFP